MFTAKHSHSWRCSSLESSGDAHFNLNSGFVIWHNILKDGVGQWFCFCNSRRAFLVVSVHCLATLLSASGNSHLLFSDSASGPAGLDLAL